MVAEDTSVAGDDRQRLDGCHLFERLGPLEHVALYPERSTCVRERGHDEVAAHDDPGTGHPHPGVVVGLPQAVTAFDGQVAQAVEEEPVLIGDGRREVLGVADNVAPAWAPDGELSIEGASQVAGGLGVALEPLGHIDMTHDVGGIVAPGGGIFHDGRGAERMVVVAVGIDHVAHGQVGQVAEFADHAGAVGEQPGIDDGRPF